MQKCKTFYGMSIEEEVTEFLSDGKKVLFLSSMHGYKEGRSVIIIYEDPAPAGIVVRNSPAHVPPTNDPLENFNKRIGYSEHEDLPEKCRTCSFIGTPICSDCSNKIHFDLPKNCEECPAFNVDFQSSGTKNPCSTCQKKSSSSKRKQKKNICTDCDGEKIGACRSCPGSLQ